jgi:hypothetical protein
MNSGNVLKEKYLFKKGGYTLKWINLNFLKKIKRKRKKKIY